MASSDIRIHAAHFVFAQNFGGLVSDECTNWRCLQCTWHQSDAHSSAVFLHRKPQSPGLVFAESFHCNSLVTLCSQEDADAISSNM